MALIILVLIDALPPSGPQVVLVDKLHLCVTNKKARSSFTALSETTFWLWSHAEDFKKETHTHTHKPTNAHVSVNKYKHIRV